MLGQLLNSSAIVAIITAGGSVLSTVGIMALKRRAAKPQDPVNVLFAHYEAFINSLLEQNAKLSMQLDAIDDELFKTKTLLFETRRDLAASTHSNLELQKQLHELKAQYGLAA